MEEDWPLRVTVAGWAIHVDALFLIEAAHQHLDAGVVEIPVEP